VLFTSSGRPVLILIHGALRHSIDLFEWVQLGEPDFDVVFIDLPGHGKSPATPSATVEIFAANVGDAITCALGNREVVVVGESLGGLVAIALGTLPLGNIRAIIAADPPLTMGKLWHIRNAIFNFLASSPSNLFLKSFALNIFGVDADGNAHERNYLPLIEQSHKPILILTGDVPLFPVRNVNAVPSLVDEIDRYVISRFAGDKAKVEIVANCGHLLLIDAQQQCRRLIAEFFVQAKQA
jgi:pimeloyl-ACP methyl ester carboxylesterase